MARTIVALDPTVGAVSVCRITEGEPMPRCGLIRSAEIHGRRTPRANVLRHVKHAEMVVEAVTAAGEPDLVVLVKFAWLSMSRDESAGRRAGVWWELARQLSALDIRIAEVSILTAEKVVAGRAQFGKKGYEVLETAVAELYPDLETPKDPYRRTTVGVALCGALAVGIQTALEVTEERLAALERGSDFPQKHRVPSSVEEWEERATGGVLL